MYKELLMKLEIYYWKRKINSLEIIIGKKLIGIQQGHDINNVLFRNYGRIVLCLKEMFVLISHGYPDGALSIARTIYEIIIITEYICKKEKECPTVIERYFADHDVKSNKNRIELYKVMGENSLLYDTCQVEITKCEEVLKTLENQYETSNFNKQYWWCTDAKHNVTFRGIDEEINDDKLLRILYKRACISIHASSMSAACTLGRENEEGNIIYTSKTYDGSELALVLGLVSHDRFLDLWCRYWNEDRSVIFPTIDEKYDKKLKDIIYIIFGLTGEGC